MYIFAVAPLVGAWIEIKINKIIKDYLIMSLPSWERGLKFTAARIALPAVGVAPLVGAWIEITQA